jgi:hypothetical protein
MKRPTAAMGMPTVRPRCGGLEAGWGVVNTWRDEVGAVEAVAVVVRELTPAAGVGGVADVANATEIVDGSCLMLMLVNLRRSLLVFKPFGLLKIPHH